MTYPHAAHWTPARFKQLDALWEQGFTASKISEKFGGGPFTRNAIIGMAHRRGLSKRARPIGFGHRSLAAPVLQRIRELWPECETVDQVRSGAGIQHSNEFILREARKIGLPNKILRFRLPASRPPSKPAAPPPKYIFFEPAPLWPKPAKIMDGGWCLWPGCGHFAPGDSPYCYTHIYPEARTAAGVIGGAA